MKFKFHRSALVREVSFSLIVYQVLMSVGYGRSYVVFLFHQLKQSDSQIILNFEQQSWIASSIGFLSPIGCILSGTLMDIFGRKLYFFVTFIPQMVSWIIIALSTSYTMLLFGMTIQGLSLGMGFTTSTYISEIATSSRRGALLGGLGVFYNIGVALCNILMYGTPWYIVAWIYAGLSLFGLLSTLLLLESPTWLYTKGRKEAAIRALCSLRASNIDDVKIKNEIEEMENSAAGKPRATCLGRLKSMLMAWKSFLISVVLQLLFQLTGYTVLFAYTIIVFEKLELKSIDSSKFAVAYSVAGIIGSIFTPFLMHWMNRKTHLKLSASIMMICTIVVAVYEEIFYDRPEKPFPYIVSVAFYIFSWACCAGLLPVSYSIGTEMYPSDVKGVLNGIFGALYYNTWSFILKFYPRLLMTVHIKIIIWSFTAFCAAVILFTIFILPETKGKTLNQVQEQYFQKKKNKVANNETAYTVST